MTESNTLLDKQSHLKIKTSTPSKALMHLNSLGLLKVTGDDATSFLQNLVTNDVNSLTINQSQLSGLCNPKGRLFAIFTILRIEENSFILIVEKSTLAILQKRLSMYILRSKVAITDESPNLSCLGLVASIDNSLKGVTFPANTYDVESIDSSIIVKLHSNTSERFIVITKNDHIPQLEETAKSDNWELTSESSWKVEEIVAGQPCIYPETQEKFTPQQLNLELINGVSFKKGCYPGQEIVARLHYLGSPSRRMFIAKSNAINEHLSGKDILNDDQTVAGQIVRAESIDETTYSLVSIKLSEMEKPLSYNGINLQLLS